jgi:hypothetical protein
VKAQQTSSSGGTRDDAEYGAFLSRLQSRFLANTSDGKAPLFMTDADLWPLYLNSFDSPEQRQHHTCHACRHFIQRFGGLVTIDDEGRTTSAFWNTDDAPDLYKPAVEILNATARRATVTGVFLSSDKVWGTPQTGIWSHLSLRPSVVHTKRVLTAGQAMAEKKEDFKNVSRALGEFTKEQLGVALTILESEALYRNEKVLGPAKWLKELKDAADSVRGSARNNIIWRAVAAAPAGFCHPRSSMIGTLLDDIAAGLSFDNLSRRFKEKMNPLLYQRPQAAPAAGTIAAAEKIVEELKVAGSLARRYARLDEIQALWKPSPKKTAETGGVFSHLQPKNTPEKTTVTLPTQKITWDKFARTVLPTAERIEFLAPYSGGYTALVTAVNPDAPPILQWDHENARNPVSWYVWAVGASARQFNLSPDTYVEVDAITLKPSMWNGGNEHQGTGVIFVLRGAKETRAPGVCLFPECLKSEFHGIRSVIEAYSQAGTIEGLQEPHAAGVLLDKGRSWSATVRVYSAGNTATYLLDRWD